MADFDTEEVPQTSLDDEPQQELVKDDTTQTPEPLSLPNKIGRCLVSALLGGVIGVAIAEVVANSLIEISLTPVFSIVRVNQNL